MKSHPLDQCQEINLGGLTVFARVNFGENKGFSYHHEDPDNPGHPLEEAAGWIEYPFGWDEETENLLITVRSGDRVRTLLEDHPDNDQLRIMCWVFGVEAPENVDDILRIT